MPSLRNIELTGPYLHNGGMGTLKELVQYYTRRADFFEKNIDDLDPDVDGIEELQENPQNIDDLVAFIKSLTDDCVQFDKVRFDHLERIIANGHITDHGVAFENEVVIPAVGPDGEDEVLPFDEIVPGPSPTDKGFPHHDYKDDHDHHHGDEDRLDADERELVELQRKVLKRL